jgi:hypothetical protein
MKTETIENILNFLQNNEGKELPNKWFDFIKKLELVKELENHPDGAQYRYEGDLDLDKTSITKLPNDLHVDGHLSLRGCSQLTKLPDNLHVEGSLNLRDCKQLRGLPDNLYFDGTLDLRDCSQITKLPKYLYVNRTLALDGTNITELPDDLHVTDSLIIVGTSIKEIPNKLYVGLNLFIGKTPLAKKYTDEEIRKIVTSTGGEIRKQIIRL